MRGKRCKILPCSALDSGGLSRGAGRGRHGFLGASLQYSMLSRHVAVLGAACLYAALLIPAWPEMTVALVLALSDPCGIQVRVQSTSGKPCTAPWHRPSIRPRLGQAAGPHLPSLARPAASLHHLPLSVPPGHRSY